jgi:hypothetical protein
MNPAAIEGHLVLVLIQWMIIIAAAWTFGRFEKNRPTARRWRNRGENYSRPVRARLDLAVGLADVVSERNAAITSAPRQARRDFSAVPGRDGI